MTGQLAFDFRVNIRKWNYVGHNVIELFTARYL